MFQLWFVHASFSCFTHNYFDDPPIFQLHVSPIFHFHVSPMFRLWFTHASFSCFPMFHFDVLPMFPPCFNFMFHPSFIFMFHPCFSYGCPCFIFMFHPCFILMFHPCFTPRHHRWTHILMRFRARDRLGRHRVDAMRLRRGGVDLPPHEEGLSM